MLRSQGQIPKLEFDYHHTDVTEPTGSSASGGKGRTESRPQAKPAPPKGPYEILGVNPGATLDEITQAYHREAQKNHPDKVATMAPEFRELAERRMKELNAAYNELRNRVK
jgi:DnaJ-class molecular chaperone